MHVVLNALCITNRSGTGRYAWGLIDGLLRLNEPDLFLSVLIPADFPLPPNWHESQRVRFYSVPIASALHRIVWEQGCLPAWLRQIKPDLLHSPAFIAPVLRATDVKQAVTIHDLTFLHYSQTIPILRRLFYRWIIPRSWRKAAAVITDSRAVAEELSALGEKIQNLIPIHLGVDGERFSSKKREDDSAICHRYGLSEPYLLFVGTREPRKNLTTLLSAYATARQRGFHLPLAIVGRYGWMEESRPDGQGVQWLGHIPDGDLPALYRGASAFLAPSLYEGFDLPPVEALACGTPAIVSDIPVHREVLGGDAVFVPCCDAGAWADAMMRLDTLIKKPPTVARRSWSDVAKDTLAIYRKLICA